MNIGFGAARPVTGRHVLAIIAGFFLVIFAVNGVFLYVSLSSHPGLSTEDAYRKGIHYNDEIAEGDRQRALGWRAAFVQDRGGAVELRLARGDAPLTGVVVDLEARRPATDIDDRKLPVSEIAPGRFRAQGQPLAPGRWRLIAEVRDEGGHRFRAEQEILVTP